MAAHEMQCHSLPIKILEFYTVQSVEFDMVLNVGAYVIIKGATVVNSCTFLACDCKNGLCPLLLVKQHPTHECCLDIETWHIPFSFLQSICSCGSDVLQ
jgi:hypothetical protein